MSRPCRGKLLLMCNYDFYTVSVDGRELSERQGAEADINNISMLFKALQFDVICHHNLTAAVITQLISACTSCDTRANFIALILLVHFAEIV